MADREKLKFYCTRCKRFIENPKPARLSVIGVVAERECDECGGRVIEFREKLKGER